MYADQIIIATSQVSMNAGPQPQVRAMAELGSDRIHLYIPNRLQKVIFIHRIRVKSFLPKVAPPALPLIYHPRVATVSIAEQITQAILVFGYRHQVHVIRHQAVSPDIDSSAHLFLNQKAQISPIVALGKKVRCLRLPRCVMWWGKWGTTTLAILAISLSP